MINMSNIAFYSLDQYFVANAQKLADKWQLPFVHTKKSAASYQYLISIEACVAEVLTLLQQQQER